MTPNFEYAWEYIRQVEGGYSDDPNDPGNYTPDGEFRGTKYGISARSYPELDIKNLTENQAKEIYYRDFWLTAGCDELPARAALAVFDFAVHSGPSRAARFWRDTQDLNALMSERLRFLQRTEHWEIYRTGWLNRLRHLMTAISELPAHAEVALIRIHQDDRYRDFVPTVATWGTTQDGGNKLMARIPAENLWGIRKWFEWKKWQEKQTAQNA